MDTNTNKKAILLSKAIGIMRILLTGYKDVSRELIWDKAAQITCMSDFECFAIDEIAAACANQYHIESFDAMLASSITTGLTSKAQRAPRRHKRHRQPDMLDRLSAMLARKEATGYSWQEDEMPDKDW